MNARGWERKRQRGREGIIKNWGKEDKNEITDWMMVVKKALDCQSLAFCGLV